MADLLKGVDWEMFKDKEDSLVWFRFAMFDNIEDACDWINSDHTGESDVPSDEIFSFISESLSVTSSIVFTDSSIKVDAT